MAKVEDAKRCDACGRLYETYNVGDGLALPNGVMLVNIDYVERLGEKKTVVEHETFDCCQECMGKITDYIERLGMGRLNNSAMSVLRAYD